MKVVYVFSGLGADKRVFKNISFQNHQTIFVDWISPKKNESIEVYAKRLSMQIKTPKPILIGLSFGGIMAIEIAKHIEPEKIILISSAKNKNEIPFLYRLAGKINLHKIIPSFLLKRAHRITYCHFGSKTTEEKILLKNILAETDSVFLKWAIDQIVKWKNVGVTKNLSHVHGDNDKILPSALVKADKVIKHGGHLMVLNHAKEVSDFILQAL